MHLYSVEFQWFSTRDILAPPLRKAASYSFIIRVVELEEQSPVGLKTRNRVIPLGRFQPARSPSNLAGAVSGLSVIRPKTQKSGKSRDRTPFSKRIGDYALIEKGVANQLEQSVVRIAGLSSKWLGGSIYASRVIGTDKGSHRG